MSLGRQAIVVTSVVIAFFAGGLVSSLASSGQTAVDAQVAIPLDDCATGNFSLLETWEVDTNFIYEFNILQISAYGPGNATLNFNIDITDPACQAIPIVKMKIDESIAIVEEGLATECPAIQHLVNAGITNNPHGVQINLEAAQTFLDQWCDGSPFPPSGP
jgi:hypothetical protein